LVLLASIGLVRAIAPFALEEALEAAGANAGVRLEIGDIDLGLLAGTVSVEALRVDVPSEVESASNPPLLEIARLSADLIWRDLLARRIHLSTVRIDETRVRLTQRADGTLALPQSPADSESRQNEDSENSVVRESVAPNQPEEETDTAQAQVQGGKPAAPWEFAIDRFELNDSDFSLQRIGHEDESVRLTLARFETGEFSLGPEGTGVGHAEFDRPSLHVEREWLLGDGDSAVETEAETSAEPTPPFRLRHFELSDGRFEIQTLNGPVEVGVRIEVSDLSTAKEHAFPIEFELRSEAGSLAVEGKLTLSPLAYQGRLSWSGLDAPPYLLITNPELVPWIQSANASGEFEVTFRSIDGDTGPAGLTLRGRTGFENLVLKDPDSDELSLYAKRFDVEVAEAIYPLVPSIARPRRVHVTSLRVESPRLVFTNPPEALDRFFALYTNVESDTDIDVPEGPGDTTEDTPGRKAYASVVEQPEPRAEPQSLFITVEAFDLSEGQIHVVDRTVSPTHETDLKHLLIKAEGVSLSPVLGADSVQIEGLVQEQGTFTLRGSLPNGQGKLQFNLRSLDLVSYDSFAKQAGWHVDSGSASLDSAIRVGNNEYEATNELVLHDLRVDVDPSNEFTSTFGHSLDFTLALLRGPGGDIALSIPVAWSAAGLGVGLDRALISATRSALVGALASPLKLAGGMLAGSDQPASLEPIRFEPGSSTLEPDSVGRVESLATLLVDRPRLALEISGLVSPTDEPALATKLLQEDAVAGLSLPDVDGAGLLAGRRVRNALRDRAAGGDATLDADDAALLVRFTSARHVPPEVRETLAQARATAVRDALAAAGVPAGSLRLGGPIDADAPGVSVELHLREQPRAEGSEGTPN
jgi:hypothetical protein